VSRTARAALGGFLGLALERHGFLIDWDATLDPFGDAGAGFDRYLSAGCERAQQVAGHLTISGTPGFTPSGKNSRTVIS
jgi:hypothetical protein